MSDTDQHLEYSHQDQYVDDDQDEQPYVEDGGDTSNNEMRASNPIGEDLRLSTNKQKK